MARMRTPLKGGWAMLSLSLLFRVPAVVEGERLVGALYNREVNHATVQDDGSAVLVEGGHDTSGIIYFI